MTDEAYPADGSESDRDGVDAVRAAEEREARQR
jgi:hypothetical protein